MDAFSVRFACEDDYESVLEISQGVYGDQDYLPNIYHTWVKDPHHLIFLGLSGKHIVGLLVANITDGDKTLVLKAMRVYKKLRGKGFCSKMSSEVYAYIRYHYPTIVRVRCVVANGYELAHLLQQKDGKNVIMEKSALSYYIRDKRHVLDQLGKVVLSHELFLSSKENIIQVLFSPSASCLCEGNIHFIDWNPYELMPSNTDELFYDDDYYFLDFNMKEQHTDNIPLTSFSHSRISQRVALTQWTVTIHTKDPVLLRTHLVYQLKTAVEVMQGKFRFVAFVNTKLFADERRFFKEELQREPYVTFGDGFKLYEKDFL